jgi:sRNA-binding protein
MTKRAREEHKGMSEGLPFLPIFQERWPLAFPKKFKDVKPLASSVTTTIIATMGWDIDYPRGVLELWKRRPSYCEAILRGGTRFDIDGNPTAEAVSEQSQAQARIILARRAEKQAESVAA